MTRPFTDEDIDPSLDERWKERGRAYHQPKPQIPLRDPRASDENLLRREAEQRDRIESALHNLGAHDRPDELREGLFGRRLAPLQPVQFAPEFEQNVAQGQHRLSASKPLTARPAHKVTQENWVRGTGDTYFERRFSPRARAQAHLLGGAAMFATAAGPLVGPAQVTPIRY